MLRRPPPLVHNQSRKQGLREAVRTSTTWTHAASVHLPLLITVTSRSFSRQRNDTMFASTQISVRMVSPGYTGAEKRTSKERMREWSYLATSLRIVRQAVL